MPGLRGGGSLSDKKKRDVSTKRLWTYLDPHSNKLNVKGICETTKMKKRTRIGCKMMLRGYSFC